ncbi:hypothetical protein [Streptomyces sioyaensis]|uniref:hypothetical protein n=1 Tax=Streptomyces sioyaensis TaxID=67364 RepID=UPI0037A599D9
MPEDSLHARAVSLEHRLAARERQRLLLRALSLRAQRRALHVRVLLRPLKLMSVVEHKVDTVEVHR